MFQIDLHPVRSISLVTSGFFVRDCFRNGLAHGRISFCGKQQFTSCPAPDKVEQKASQEVNSSTPWQMTICSAAARELDPEDIMDLARSDVCATHRLLLRCSVMAPAVRIIISLIVVACRKSLLRAFAPLHIIWRTKSVHW